MKTILFSVALIIGALCQVQAQDRLKANMTVDLRIVGVPTDDIQTISAPYTIDSSGFLPQLTYLKGKVKAAGLTTTQLADRIRKMYVEQQIFTRPNVVITTSKVDIDGQTVTINGEVKSPRLVPYQAGMKLMDVVASAGGFTIWAVKKEVRLIRAGKATNYDVRRYTDDPAQNPMVKPGDEIVILHR